MDKYTVDLDKVLNDFEYSELTDQYVRPSSHNNNNRVKNGGGSTKHSINNVFHSLNEYLNTDVSDKCKVVGEFVTDNNFLDNDDDEKKEEVEEVQEEEAQVVVVVNDSETINCVNNADDMLNDKTNDDETSELLEDSQDLIAESVEILETEVEVTETQSEHVVEKEHEDLREIEIVEVSNLVNLEPVLEVPEKCDTKQEEQVPFVGFNEPIDIEEAELTKYLDDLEDELNEEETKTTPVDSQIETIEETVVQAEENTSEDKNNVSRPDSLPLDTTEQKKDINLIGEC